MSTPLPYSGSPSDNKGPTFIALFSVGLFVAIVLVAMRLWVRIKMVGKVGLDDWTVLASLIVTCAAFGCLATSTYYGLGMHLATIPPAHITPLLKIFWAAMFMTPSAEAFAKFSITLMLIRITTSKAWKIFFYTLIGLFSAVTIVTLAADVTQCKPLAYLWNPYAYPDGTCDRGAEISTAYLQGVSAALYDVILSVTPIFLLWNVQIDMRKKIALCSVLSLGFLYVLSFLVLPSPISHSKRTILTTGQFYSTSIAGILRTAYTPGALNIADFTYTVMDFMIWKAIELPLSIIVGCLPTLRPLFVKLIDATQRKTGGRSGYVVQPDSHNMAKVKVASGKGNGAKGSNTSSSEEDSRLYYYGAHSIVKETTWAVEEEV
ncbi:hypothetical protein MMC19_002540 [Ptychographa xylographoides]|nr:hypothetical protein [Ptychographa xylographoides]